MTEKKPVATARSFSGSEAFQRAISSLVESGG
jgi:hypothetical protein